MEGVGTLLFQELIKLILTLQQDSQDFILMLIQYFCSNKK